MERSCERCGKAYLNGEEFCTSDGTPLREVAADADPHLAQALEGRLVLQRLLHRSACSVLYQALHPMIERTFAVKLWRTDRLGPAEAARVYERARPLCQVPHSSIPLIYDAGQSLAGDPYIVMQLIAGVSLQTLLRDSTTGDLPVGRVVDFARQIAGALRVVHGAGLVHGDLEPRHLLVVEEESGDERIKLVGFRLAARDAARGNVEYLASECQQGPPTAASDLYALGIFLHHSIIGSPPFRGGTAAQIREHHHTTVPALLSRRRHDLQIPRELDELTAQLLDKDPAGRPGAEEVVQALERVRALLPPASLQSLLLARTLLFSSARQGLALTAAETVVRLSTAQPLLCTALTFSLLCKLDEQQDKVDRLSQRLFEQARALVLRLPSSEAAVALQRALARCEAGGQDEREQSEEVALLEEQREQVRRTRERRAEVLRVEILELSRRREATPRAGRQALQEAMDRQYRALFSLGSVEDARILDRLDQARRKVQTLRDRLQGLRRELARQALGACPPTLHEDGRRLQELVDKHDGARALLRLLCQEARAPLLPEAAP